MKENDRLPLVPEAIKIAGSVNALFLENHIGPEPTGDILYDVPEKTDDAVFGYSERLIDFAMVL